MTMELTVFVCFIGIIVTITLAFLFVVKAIIDGISDIRRAKEQDKAMLNYYIRTYG